MSKRKGRMAFTTKQPTTPQNMKAFTFGEPSPVMDKREILDHLECCGNGKWYEPPTSLEDSRAVCGPPYTTVHRCL